MSEPRIVGMDTLLAAIACCNAWEPQVRLIGNVQAVDLGDLLRELQARRNADQPNLARGCHRSHPHDDMDAGCERLTEIAREANRAANQPTVRMGITDGWPRCLTCENDLVPGTFWCAEHQPTDPVTTSPTPTPQPNGATGWIDNAVTPPGESVERVLVAYPTGLVETTQAHYVRLYPTNYPWWMPLPVAPDPTPQPQPDAVASTFADCETAMGMEYTTPPCACAEYYPGLPHHPDCPTRNADPTDAAPEWPAGYFRHTDECARCGSYESSHGANGECPDDNGDLPEPKGKHHD